MNEAEFERDIWQGMAMALGWLIVAAILAGLA
jgi:hypothetical protein